MQAFFLKWERGLARIPNTGMSSIAEKIVAAATPLFLTHSQGLGIQEQLDHVGDHSPETPLKARGRQIRFQKKQGRRNSHAGDLKRSRSAKRTKSGKRKSHRSRSRGKKSKRRARKSRSIAEVATAVPEGNQNDPQQMMTLFLLSKLFQSQSGPKAGGAGSPKGSEPPKPVPSSVPSLSLTSGQPQTAETGLSATFHSSPSSSLGTITKSLPQPLGQETTTSPPSIPFGQSTTGTQEAQPLGQETTTSPPSGQSTTGTLEAQPLGQKTTTSPPPGQSTSGTVKPQPSVPAKPLPQQGSQIADADLKQACNALKLLSKDLLQANEFVSKTVERAEAHANKGALDEALKELDGCTQKLSELQQLCNKIGTGEIPKFRSLVRDAQKHPSSEHLQDVEQELKKLEDGIAVCSSLGEKFDNLKVGLLKRTLKRQLGTVDACLNNREGSKLVEMLKIGGKAVEELTVARQNLPGPMKPLQEEVRQLITSWKSKEPDIHDKLTEMVLAADTVLNSLWAGPVAADQGKKASDILREAATYLKAFIYDSPNWSNGPSFKLVGQHLDNLALLQDPLRTVVSVFGAYKLAESTAPKLHLAAGVEARMEGYLLASSEDFLEDADGLSKAHKWTLTSRTWFQNELSTRLDALEPAGTWDYWTKHCQKLLKTNSKRAYAMFDAEYPGRRTAWTPVLKEVQHVVNGLSLDRDELKWWHRLCQMCELA